MDADRPQADGLRGDAQEGGPLGSGFDEEHRQVGLEAGEQQPGCAASRAHVTQEGGTVEDRRGEDGTGREGVREVGLGGRLGRGPDEVVGPRPLRTQREAGVESVGGAGGRGAG